MTSTTPPSRAVASRIAAVLFAALMVLCVGCSAPEDSTENESSEMVARTPEDLLPMITAAINAGDLIEVLKYWDDEGCFGLPDGELVCGSAGLRAMYEQRLALRPEITERPVKIIQAGDVALVTGVWSTRIRNGKIDGKDSFEGIATIVLRRHADGGWRILVDCSSRPPC
jgi:ketosteroid isomerase-like protein